jgi:hypothetical protein
MLDLEDSQRRAEQRLARASKRRRRSDAGRTRLHPVVLDALRSLVLGSDRPSMAAIQRRITDLCARHGLRPPSRASLYNALSTIPGHTYRVPLMPPPVGEALYNLTRNGRVPGHQLVFYCFNYGSLAAMSYAAGLPWIDLYQAMRLRGWRPRSRGLLKAAMRVRGIL